ncbi:ribosome hibernation-promoting factor, HPF/YfiA family [Gilvimarinus japonicus]|jgi:putative sigma-54 modulation protein|uniref:Ribosome hibernation promoting factor n=1 Tax=Gilvimarinus japonicus TaxID=1796469 RepID=A0ABV7HJQ1_9GAMM
MQIQLSGHHVDITDAIREAVNTKFGKVNSHFPQLESLSVTLTVERASQSVEATTQYLGAAVAVQAANHDMYAAIAQAAKKLEAALAHRKGSVKSNRHEKPQLTEEEPVDQAS